MTTLFGSIRQVVLGFTRNGRWRGVRNRKLKANPFCIWCGRKAETVHHVIPFSRDRSKELDPANLASMCDRCHFSVGHHCNWEDYNENFWACIEANKTSQPGVKTMPSQFPHQAGRTFVRDEPDPQPQPEPPVHIEIGTRLKTVLLAFIAVLMVLAQGYVVYLTHKTKDDVEEVKTDAREARSEATRALIQGEKNGIRLKKQADEKRAQENRHRAMIGLPPILPEFDNE